jgi:hypothetical protein
MLVKGYSSILLPFILEAYAAAAGPDIVPGTNSSRLTMRTATVLANGTSMQYSSSPLPNGLNWQASGYVWFVAQGQSSNIFLYQTIPLCRFLQRGGCSSTKQLIKDCYELRLTNDPSMQLDPGSATPRQRIEFLTAHRAGLFRSLSSPTCV